MSECPVCVTVTYDCNWDCPYCIADTHATGHVDFSDAIKFVESLEPNSYAVISGGEPGLLTDNQLLDVISILRKKNCKIKINTNGEIFKYPEVVAAVDSVWYHCSVNMDIDDYVNKNFLEKTRFIVIVTDNNIKNLDGFLSKHDDIRIGIIPARKGRMNRKGETLSIHNRMKLINKYKDRMSEYNLKLAITFGGVLD